MSKSSTLEIVTTAGNLVTIIGDVPALSVLKPIGGILVTICAHVAALKDNKEAAILLAERVNQAVRVLINHARDLDGATPGNYLNDIKNLEDVFLKIGSTLEKLRQRKWYHRVFSPKADASELNSLSSDLDYAIRIFGLSADFEARRAFQTITALATKELERILGSSELDCPTVDPLAIELHYELDANDDCSVQMATYNKQAVIVKKYYPTSEKIFAQDLRQRLKQMHPGIAYVMGSNTKAAIIVLSVKDLIFCTQDLIDLESIRRPWQERRIISPVPSHSWDETSFPDDPARILIKESDTLLQQFIRVMRFLKRMNVEVAWWQFRPSWVGLQGSNRVILIDWAQDQTHNMGGEFEPQYAIHITGLGFSASVPDAFRNAERFKLATPITNGSPLPATPSTNGSPLPSTPSTNGSPLPAPPPLTGGSPLPAAPITDGSPSSIVATTHPPPGFVGLRVKVSGARSVVGRPHHRLM